MNTENITSHVSNEQHNARRRSALRIVMDGENFKLENIDPLEAQRIQREIEAAPEADRLSISEHLMVLGLRKASKDDLRRIILDAMAAEAAA